MSASLVSTVVNLTLADVQFEIGELFTDADGNPINGGEGSFAHALLHGLAGCAAGAALNGSSGCAPGAAGAIAQSLFAGSLDGVSLEEKQERLAQAEFIGALAGFLFSQGDGENVDIAAMVAASAFAHNYLTHIEAEEREQAKQDCAEGDQAACDRVKELDQLDQKRDHQLAACASMFGSKTGCDKVILHALITLKDYIGIHSVWNLDETTLDIFHSIYVDEISSIIEAVNADLPILSDSQISLLTYGIAIDANDWAGSIEEVEHLIETEGYKDPEVMIEAIFMITLGRKIEKLFKAGDKAFEAILKRIPDKYKHYFGVDIDKKFDFSETGSGTHLRRTVNVDNNKIQINSGHGYNRSHSSGDVRDSGLSMDQIDNAIANDIVKNIDVNTLPTVPARKDITISIDGYRLTYRTSRLLDGTISVSTYFPG